MNFEIIKYDYDSESRCYFKVGCLGFYATQRISKQGYYTKIDLTDTFGRDHQWVRMFESKDEKSLKDLIIEFINEFSNDLTDLISKLNEFTLTAINEIEITETKSKDLPKTHFEEDFINQTILDYDFKIKSRSVTMMRNKIVSKFGPKVTFKYLLIKKIVPNKLKDLGISKRGREILMDAYFNNQRYI